MDGLVGFGLEAVGEEAALAEGVLGHGEVAVGAEVEAVGGAVEAVGDVVEEVGGAVEVVEEPLLEVVVFSIYFFASSFGNVEA